MLNITFYSTISLDCPMLDARQSALASLLSLGRNQITHQPIAALICQEFAVQAHPDYPLAALASAQHTDQLSQNKADYYLQADPVHLTLQRDCFVLSDPKALSISASEMQALCAVLNQHFLEDGLVFELTPKPQLLLRLATAPHIKTSLPEAAVGRNVFTFLPQGAEASQWNKIINEVQMLLHDHPINQQREAIGLPAINSIWLSGGGVLPSVVESNFTHVYTDVAYLQKLAQLAGVALYDLAHYLDGREQGHGLTKGKHKDLKILIALDILDHTDYSRYSAYFDLLLNQIKQGATLQLNLAFEELVLSCVITPRNLKMRMLKQCFLTLMNKNKSARQTLQIYFQAHLKRMQSSF